MDLIKKIKELMSLHGFESEAHLASSLSISQTTLNRFLNGKTKKPNQILLKKISDFFEISFDSLLNNIPFNQIYISEDDRFHDSPGKVLRYLMNDIGNISEGELSRRTSVPQPTIHRILSGQTSKPREESIEPIARFFNITADQLLARVPLPVNRIPGTFVSTEKTTQRVPVLDWEEVLHWPYIGLKKDFKDFISTDIKINHESYALKLNTNEYFPEFRINTILIVDYHQNPKNDQLVISSDESKNLIIAKINLLNNSMSITPLNINFKKIDKYQIHGVIAESRRIF